LKDRGPRLII